MYTASDIARLRLLQAAAARGHAIGRLAKLSNRELRALDQPGPVSIAAPPPTTIDTASLLDAIERFDAHAAEIELARLAALLRPAAFLHDVVMPALADVDAARPSDRRFRIAHEHLLSTVIRNILGSLLHLHARGDAPGRLLFATTSGEPHEFGALGAATLAASSGLASSISVRICPRDEIVDTALAASVDVVVLGVTMAEDAIGCGRADAARGTAAGDVELWLGGPGAAAVRRVVGPRGIVIPDYSSLEEELYRVGARA